MPSDGNEIPRKLNGPTLKPRAKKKHCLRVCVSLLRYFGQHCVRDNGMQRSFDSLIALSPDHIDEQPLSDQRLYRARNACYRSKIGVLNLRNKQLQYGPSCWL